MLRYFNKGYFSRTLVLLFFAVILWVPAFLLPTETAVPENAAPLYRLLLLLTGCCIYLQLAVAFVLSMASALLLNQLAANSDLTEKTSQWGILLYVLMISALVSQTAMTPLVFVNFFMLLSLHFLFDGTEAKDPIPAVLNASLMLGIASLFYLPAVLFILLLWVAFAVFHINQWRNFAVSVIGTSIPLVFTYVWYFWYDRSTEAVDLFLASLTPRLPGLSGIWPFDRLIAVILFLFILVAALKVNGGLMEKKINLRHVQVVLLNYLILTLAMTVFYSPESGTGLAIAIPAALVLAAAMAEAKKLKWYEWTVRLTFILVLLNQYLHLFYAA